MDFPAWMSAAKQRLAKVSSYGERLAFTRGESLEVLATKYPHLNSTLSAFKQIKESLGGGGVVTGQKTRINWDAYRELEPKKGVVDAFKKLYDERVCRPPPEATPEERKKYLYPKRVDVISQIWNADTLDFLEKRRNLWEIKAEYSRVRAADIQKEIEQKKSNDL